MTSLPTPAAGVPSHRDRLRRWCRAVHGLDPRSLAASRIALGAIVVADALLRTRDLRLLFALDGCLPPDLVRALAPAGSWSLAWLADADWMGPLLIALEAVAGVAVCIGYRTRLATVAAWIAVTSVWRRTAPAANGGDVWLALQLLWGCFLPWGDVWSWDTRRRPRPSAATMVRSPATAAVVLQLAAVYLAAGLAKAHGDWLTGDAVGHALAADHHGTVLGDLIAGQAWLTRLLGPAIVGLELTTPLLLLAAPSPQPRVVLATTLIAFHLATWLTMSLGLFPPVAVAAWLAVLPSRCWSRTAAPAVATTVVRFRPTQAACVALVALAGIEMTSRLAGGRPPLGPLGAAAQAAGVIQPWELFATVPAQRQWIYTLGRLADGRVVDVLRGGRAVAGDAPSDGFLGLPHDRWRELCWRLPRPGMEPLARATVAALARDWNDRHPDAPLVALELRAARRGDGPADAEQDVHVAAWPRRTPQGAGGLDRFLDAVGPDGESPPE